jgi:adenylosuccinate lyase
MIPRYEEKEISQLWTDEAKYRAFLQVELAILKAQEGGQIPQGTADKIAKLVQVRPQRVDEIERTTRHDVIAFCTSITEQLPTELGKFFHFGVTSSDIIDTALSLQIKASLEKVDAALTKVRQSLLNMAMDHKTTMTIGRSHGMYAEPMSLGGKFLGHYCEFSRRQVDYQRLMQEELTAQFSGAVGNYAVVSPQAEAKAAHQLGLKLEASSTQVIPRDRLATIIQSGAMIANAIERLCVEIRHLHRSEVGELSEGFAQGQKGSSTMPHKKNPIAAENLTGIARIIRSHVNVAYENSLLWHERDISHSSAERLMLPDHFGLLTYALSRLSRTLDNLEINRPKIEARVTEQSTYLSSYYLHQLLLQTNLPREELYLFVQQAAFEAQNKGRAEVFIQSLQTQLTQKNIKATLIAPTEQGLKEIYLKYTGDIYKRALEQYPL